MDYENMSDFEINKRVAKSQSLIINEQQGASLKANSSSVLVNCITESWEFNPCKNPSDAWPIIVENKISLQYEGGFRHSWESSHCKHLDEYDVEMVGPIWNENPLRAAMIVYLMMQEDK